ncbi:MAG: glycosyltransferase family 2 protein [Erythrobacter sp.]
MIDSVSVVIPAYNSSATIGAAITSALQQDEVEQVFVVDDASNDNTAAIARVAAGSDRRFVLLEQDRNQGPSAARNRAIAQSDAAWIAILDADDQFLPGRFGAMKPQNGTDMVADNIMFVRHEDLGEDGRVASAAMLSGQNQSFQIDFEKFVLANLSRPDRLRGELGFIKPVIRRSLFDRLDLHYAENCRLGEDFLLYCKALAKGARFEISLQTGYIALRRDNSLSLRHGARELEQLLIETISLLETLANGTKEREALKAYIRTIRRKLDYREVLDRRREQGLFSGLRRLALSPAVARTILKDKIVPSEDPVGACGLLISADDIAALGVVADSHERAVSSSGMCIERD